MTIWTANHQMMLNGKNNNFVLEDFKSCALAASMKRGRAERIVEDVMQAVFLKAIAKTSSLREPASARAWRQLYATSSASPVRPSDLSAAQTSMARARREDSGVKGTIARIHTHGERLAVLSPGCFQG